LEGRTKQRSFFLSVVGDNIPPFGEPIHSFSLRTWKTIFKMRLLVSLVLLLCTIALFTSGTGNNNPSSSVLGTGFTGSQGGGKGRNSRVNLNDNEMAKQYGSSQIPSQQNSQQSDTKAPSFLFEPQEAESKMSSKSRQERELLYEAYNLLHTLAQDFHKPFDAPAVIVVGHQTSGKSALIEALMGFQFNQVSS